ncbi:MAG: T9SS type A sorting domain-containing protein, partial [Bacteroidota bacterium]|nr:T9SS type A sorting domain-containing protein [Bacteroidota bacterium]
VKTVSEQVKNVYLSGNYIVSEFALAKESDVTMAVYDVQGKLMAKYTNWFSAGSNKKVIDTTLPTGIYIVKITSDEFSVSTKVIK